MKFSTGVLDPGNDAVWDDFQEALVDAGLERIYALRNEIFARNPVNLR